MKSVENNCYFPDLVQAFPNEKGWFTSEMRTFLLVSCWAWRSCSSCSLSGNKSSKAAAFFFRIVTSSLYVMQQELKVVESLLCLKIYKFLCLVELLRTDWRGCSEACLLYAHGSTHMWKTWATQIWLFHDTCDKHYIYENVAVFTNTLIPSRYHRSFFLHAKDFAFAHKVAAEAWKIQPAVTRWVKMASQMARSFTIRPECEHFHTRVSICFPIRDSETPVLRLYIARDFCSCERCGPWTFCFNRLS